MSVYDLLSGDEPYKHGWTDGARPLRHMALFPASARGYLAYGVLLWPRWRLRNLPAARAAVQALQGLPARAKATLTKGSAAPAADEAEPHPARTAAKPASPCA